jgi:hypothetical protein
VPDVIREMSRTDAVAASTTLAVVGAALAWWLPSGSVLHDLGLALLILGPLGLLATLTLMPTADVDRIEAELHRNEPVPDPAADPARDDIDERLPELDLQHSVRA